jgi:hypothetical protein
MQPQWIRQLSKRDMARLKFVNNFRAVKKRDTSVILTLQEQLERMRDIEDGKYGED